MTPGVRKILAVTSGRADASPMAPVIEALRALVGGVEHDGLIRHRCEVKERDFLDYNVTEAAYHIETDGYDIVLLLGDRWEIGFAALAATVARVPIAHIHGGESSYGSFDNQIRDAVTKLAHIHFVATPAFETRLRQLGEEMERVHVVGAPGLDNLVDLPPRKPEKYFVVTYHPATLGEDRIHPLIKALDRFGDYTSYWTGVNNDPGSVEIRQALDSAAAKVVHWTPAEYLLRCRHAAAVIGNSSSGIIEAPTLGVPTVNIGIRQDGRDKGPSVFDCSATSFDIEQAITRALHWNGSYDNPYGGPGASAKIADILSTIDLDGILVKR